MRAHWALMRRKASNPKRYVQSPVRGRAATSREALGLEDQTGEGENGNTTASHPRAGPGSPMRGIHDPIGPGSRAPCEGDTTLTNGGAVGSSTQNRRAG